MADLLSSSNHIFHFFSWINLKNITTQKNFKMDRSAIYTIFVCMHKRITKNWGVLFHSNKTLAFSFCVLILLICHCWKSLWRKCIAFQSHFSLPWDYLLQKQCEDSHKWCTWVGKIKCPQKLCSRPCPDKGIERKVWQKAFLSQWSEKNKIIFQAITWIQPTT